MSLLFRPGLCLDSSVKQCTLVKNVAEIAKNNLACNLERRVTLDSNQTASL